MKWVDCSAYLFRMVWTDHLAQTQVMVVTVYPIPRLSLLRSPSLGFRDSGKETVPVCWLSRLGH